MAKTRPETIILKGDPIMAEAEAGGAITPGHLVILNSSGNVVVNATADAAAAPMFAKENDIAGDDYTHAYASGEVVQYFTAYPGMEVQALLADGENASIGSFLESAANGELEVVAGAATAVAIALEAVNLSDSAADPTSEQRIKVRII